MPCPRLPGRSCASPQYLARIGQALRPPGNRADLLDQADEFQRQIGASWAAVTNNVGVLKARTDRRDEFDVDLSEGALVGKALEGEATQGTWIESTEDGGFILYQAVGVPIYSPGTAGQRALYGVLVAAVPIDSAFVADVKRNTNSDVVIVALDTMNVPQVAVSTLERAAVTNAMAGGPGMDTSLAGLQPGGHVRWDVGGETLVGVVGPLVTASGTPVGGYVGFRSRSRELAVFTELQQTVLYAFIGGLILAILSSVVLARQITRPVKQLVEVTRQVGEGQYSGNIEVRTRDEIGVLAASFQRMLQELKEKQALIEYMSTSSAAATQALTQQQLSDVTQKVGPGMATRAVAVSGGQMLEAGFVLDDRYEIKRVLGVGGMGVVYRAVDRELDEVVAIKTLKPDAIQADGSSLERFKQEIRLARRITHRNVVRTHDMGEVQGMYYITMEFVEGTSLKDLIRKRGHLPTAVALTVGKQLLRALEVAHEQGVIHRDIKPQNMVVDAAGFLKVMDFGIARLTESKQQEAKGLTAAGVAIGTPEYMAPEQLMGEEIDVRADLYAAGAVLFECVTGRPVFIAPTVTALMVKHLEEKPVDPREIQPGVPARLAEIILKALNKEREDRWQTAAAFHEALEGVRVEATGSQRVSGSVTQPA
ncbi:MAG: HAMP domain-containing protein [Gemmatimonadetes bacterium]|nr:HAMP domain-containing protein [Gemmatimonadota bacterium]